MATLRDFIQDTLPKLDSGEVSSLVERLESIGIHTKDDCSKITQDQVQYLNLTAMQRFKILEKCQIGAKPNLQRAASVSRPVVPRRPTTKCRIDDDIDVLSATSAKATKPKPRRTESIKPTVPQRIPDAGGRGGGLNWNRMSTARGPQSGDASREDVSDNTSGNSTAQHNALHHDLNILLLGETGVGKSTWINGFANYLKFSTLKEAMSSSTIIAPIPTSFTIYNDNYGEQKVCTGTDGNENPDTTQSATQQPKTYVFTNGVVSVRVIDTPGIPDTRGLEQDRVNLQHILSHIGNIVHLHGICILLKPNNARLTINFKFCIMELLAQLHVEAAKNLVFCFTNSRVTNYRPGETLAALNKLLGDRKEIVIEKEKTLFCMDNEAVRYLFAVKYGVKFSDDVAHDFTESWKMSVQSIAKLIEHFQSLEPYRAKNSLSLNDARRMIVEIAQPLEEISENIHENICALESKQRELQLSDVGEITTEDLLVPQIEIRCIRLDRPIIICVSDACTTELTENGVTTIYHHCSFDAETASRKDDSNACSKCNCSWNFHKKTTYICEKFTTTSVEDKKVQPTPGVKLKEMSLDNATTRLRGLIEELTYEQETIITVSRRFASFLNKYALAPNNIELVGYLKLFVEEKGNTPGADRVALEKIRQKHMRYSAILEKCLFDNQSDDNPPTADDIKDMIASLYYLEHSGHRLREVFETADEGQQKAIQLAENLADVRVEQTAITSKNALQKMFAII